MQDLDPRRMSDCRVSGTKHPKGAEETILENFEDLQQILYQKCNKTTFQSHFRGICFCSGRSKISSLPPRGSKSVLQRYFWNFIVKFHVISNMQLIELIYEVLNVTRESEVTFSSSSIIEKINAFSIST